MNFNPSNEKSWFIVFRQKIYPLIKEIASIKQYDLDNDKNINYLSNFLHVGVVFDKKKGIFPIGTSKITQFPELPILSKGEKKLYNWDLEIDDNLIKQSENIKTIQINLEELHKESTFAVKQLNLPKSGMLYFIFNNGYYTWKNELKILYYNGDLSKLIKIQSNETKKYEYKIKFLEKIIYSRSLFKDDQKYENCQYNSGLLTKIHESYFNKRAPNVQRTLHKNEKVLFLTDFYKNVGSFIYIPDKCYKFKKGTNNSTIEYTRGKYSAPCFYFFKFGFGKKKFLEHRIS